MHKDKPEKSNDKPNEKPSDKASSKLHATVNSRKSTDKALAKPEKAEKGAVPEAQKPKNPPKFSVPGNNSRKPHKGNPKKEPDYDELLIPFDDDEPG